MYLLNKAKVSAMSVNLIVEQFTCGRDGFMGVNENTEKKTD